MSQTEPEITSVPAPGARQIDTTQTTINIKVLPAGSEEPEPDVVVSGINPGFHFYVDGEKSTEAGHLVIDGKITTPFADAEGREFIASLMHNIADTLVGTDLEVTDA